MKKRKPPLLISIPKACSQDWEKMESKGKGKYCSSCQKEVIDFSHFSDKELYDFFYHNKVIPCGRFHSSQLNQQIISTTPKRRSWLSLSKRIAAVFAFLSLKFTESKAQTKISTIIETTTKTSASNADNQKFIIDGSVKDESGNGIAGVDIRLNDQPVAKSDSNGSFRFEIDIAVLPKSGVLQFNSPGLVTVVRSYHPAMQSTSYNVTLAKPHEHHGYTMGMPVYQTAFEPFRLTRPKEHLTSGVRAKLAATAMTMRNHPYTNMLLVGYGTTQNEIQNAKRFLAAVKNYFIEREGISEDRIHTKIKSKQQGDINTIDVSSKKPNE